MAGKSNSPQDRVIAWSRSAQERMQERLGMIERRLQQIRSQRWSFIGWCLAAACVLIIGTNLPTSTMGRVAVLAFLAVGVTVLGLAMLMPRRGDGRRAIEAVETKYPNLKAALVTAAQQHPEVESGEYHVLQEELFSKVLQHGRQHPWSEAVSEKSIRGWRIASWCGFALFLVIGLWRLQPRPSGSDAQQLVETTSETVGDDPQAAVVPGDAEVEKGHGLSITATFAGGLPRDVSLVTTTTDGQESRVPLNRSLSDPVWGMYLSEVTDDVEYRIEFDGETTESYQLTVFEYPTVEQIDADVSPPEYTGRDDEHLPDVRRVSVFEGSDLSLQMQLNKPVASAIWENNEGKLLEFAANTDDEALWLAGLTPETDGEWWVRLVDEAGRINQDEIKFVITVVPNQRPEMEVAFPSRDVRVSPLEELLLEGKAWDDIGVAEFGLMVQLPPAEGQFADEMTIPLAGTTSPIEPATPTEVESEDGDADQETESIIASHMLALEEWGVQPDDLIAYSFYADDIGPDGETRRTFSDLFFAEVRPFEEIFREMPGEQGQQQQQQGQGGGGAQQAGAEQKEIVSAIWNMIRKYDFDPPSTGFVDDIEVIRLGQEEVRTAFEEAAAQYADELMRQHAAAALTHMSNTEQQLVDAIGGPTITTLPNGLDEAQAAYRELLKLQAREHLISQSESSSSSSSSSSQNQARQQQLEELELSNDRNRYETQEQQQSPEEGEEQRQILNRLKELARRQEAINDRLQELEEELRNAQDEEERERIERELLRLREQQQEMLQDLDELRERTEQQANPEQRQEAREALDETRERMYRSSEALEQGQVSRAVTEGTRAERELRELEDEVRQQAEGEFADAVRGLQEEVEELANREDELRNQIAGQNSEGEAEEEAPPTLRQEEADNQQPLAQDLADQSQRLNSLLDRMQDVVESSEESEPLLSRTLYEGMRSSDQHSPEEALQATSNLVRQGLRQQALQAEQSAQAGIEELQEAITQAADDVLGSELSALERARDELAQAADALSNEMQANRPGQESQTGEPQPGEGQQPGESPMGEGQPGQTGEPMDGQQPGQGQEPGDQPGQGQQPGQQPGQGGQPMEGTPMQGGAPGEPMPGENPMGQSPGMGETPGQGQTPGQSQTPGQNGEGQPMSGSPMPGSQTGSQGSQNSQPSGSPSGGGTTSGSDGLSALSNFFEGPSGSHDGDQSRLMPLTSEDFAEWSDQLRDIEEMLTDTPWQGDVQQIRERARQVRIDYSRHSQDPNWDLVSTEIYGPLLDLQQEIADEIARQNPEDRTTPIDRDPAPPQYADAVDEYFRRLSETEGAGEQAISQ